MEGNRAQTPAADKEGFAKLFEDIRNVALPLLVSGGGLLGFVAFAGGVKTWAQFSAANLPAGQAVAAMPKSELVTSGAVSLTFFAALGLLATLTTYLINNKGTPNKGMLYGMLLLVVLEAAAVLVLARDSEHLSRTKEAAGALIFLVALTVAGIETSANPERDVRGWLTGRTARRQSALALLKSTWAWFKKTPSGDKREDEHGPRLTLSPLGNAYCAILAALSGPATGLLTHEWWVGVSLPFAGLLAFGCMRVAHRATPNFAWFGVAVFFSVSLFGAVVETLRTLDEPQVQPMALIRAGDGPGEGLQGIYITETEERVYMASVAANGCNDTDLEGDSGRLFWVPREQVTGYAIGTLQDANSASVTAPEILEDLVATRIPGKTKPPAVRALNARTSPASTKRRTGAEAQRSRSASAPRNDLARNPSRRASRPITIAPAIRKQPQIVRVKRLNKASADRGGLRSAKPGDTIELLGSDFGPRATVSVGPVAATVATWKQHAVRYKRLWRDRITFIVPPRATTNRVVLSCPRKAKRGHVLYIEPQ